MPVRQVVYLSAAVRHMGADALDALLRRTRERNRQSGVTGLLLYGDGSFLQVLEGEPQVIADLYDTIRVDPRHKGLIKVSDTEVPARKFADWSMAWRRLDTAPEDVRDSFRQLRDDILADVAVVQGADVVAFMVSSFLSALPEAPRRRS